MYWGLLYLKTSLAIGMSVRGVKVTSIRPAPDMGEEEPWHSSSDATRAVTLGTMYLQTTSM